MGRRACVSKRYVHVGLQKLIPSWWQPLGGQNGLQTGQLEPGKRAILGQRSARTSCRKGFGGQQVRCRVCVSKKYVHVGLQKLLPNWWQPLGCQNGLQTGQLEPGTRAILGQKSARIRCGVGFGGQHFEAQKWQN